MSSPGSHNQLVMGEAGFAPRAHTLTTAPEKYPHPNVVGAQRDYDNKPIELCFAQGSPSLLAHGTFLSVEYLYCLNFRGTVGDMGWLPWRQQGRVAKNIGFGVRRAQCESWCLDVPTLRAGLCNL